MGFLSMCGLMKVEDHAKVKRELATANADIEKSAAIIVRQKSTIESAIAERDKAKREIAPLRDRIGELERQLTESALLAAERAKEIAALTPDAEATRKRRANGAKRVRPSRAKAPAVVKAAPKAKKGAGK